MKYFFLSYFFIAVLVVGAAGLRGSKSDQPPLEILPDMDNQAKLKFQAKSDFFADGIGGRRPVENTIPMGFEVPSQPAADNPKPPTFGFSNGLGYYHTGRMGDYYGDGMPEEISVSPEFVARGMERFNIHCAICHGASGNGKGVTSQYGILTAFNLVQAGADDPANAGAYRTDGAIFDVISHGKGLMGSYGANITVQDRWAIVAYIRAMQNSLK